MNDFGERKCETWYFTSFDILFYQQKMDLSIIIHGAFNSLQKASSFVTIGLVTASIGFVTASTTSQNKPMII